MVITDVNNNHNNLVVMYKKVIIVIVPWNIECQLLQLKLVFKLESNLFYKVVSPHHPFYCLGLCIVFADIMFPFVFYVFFSLTFRSFPRRSVIKVLSNILSAALEIYWLCCTCRKGMTSVYWTFFMFLIWWNILCPCNIYTLSRSVYHGGHISLLAWQGWTILSYCIYLSSEILIWYIFERYVCTHNDGGQEM